MMMRCLEGSMRVWKIGKLPRKGYLWGGAWSRKGAGEPARSYQSLTIVLVVGVGVGW